MAEAAGAAAIDPLKESGAITTMGGCAGMRGEYDKGGLLSITKVRDAPILYIVIPAYFGNCAGIYWFLSQHGSPLKPALECLNRGRG
jgi:hypothetical protein